MEIYMDENGGFAKEPATAEELCEWARAFQKSYFPDCDVPGMEIAINVSPDIQYPSVYYPEIKTIHISERITHFHELAKIAILHEMIHIKLYAENNDADTGHGVRFQAELQRLMFRERAYDRLL